MGWQFEVNNRLSVVLCISQRRVSGWGGSESKGVEPLIGMNCPWRAVGLFSKVVQWHWAAGVFRESTSLCLALELSILYHICS